MNIVSFDFDIKEESPDILFALVFVCIYANTCIIYYAINISYDVWLNSLNNFEKNFIGHFLWKEHTLRPVCICFFYPYEYMPYSCMHADLHKYYKCYLVTIAFLRVCMYENNGKPKQRVCFGAKNFLMDSLVTKI